MPLFQTTGSIHQQQNITATPTNNTAGSPLSEEDTLSPYSLTGLDTEMNADFEFSFASASGGGEASNFFDEHLDYTSLSSFEPINHAAPASDVQTVSPKDIMAENMSAPPSTTFTELTTPGTSYEQSPYGMLDTSETSPLFSEADLDKDAQNWPSLFETTEVVDDFTPQPAMNTNTGSTVATSYNASPRTTHVAPKMSRNDSSPGSSSKGGRHSFTSGVAAKRRDKPLPEIHVEDPTDTTAVKRARNTMAARKSRQKRMERTEQLESKVVELEDEVEHWKSIALSRGHVE